MYLFQELKTPHGFSEQVYEIVTERLGLSFDEIFSLITKGEICQNGHCWDLGDVGSNCC